MPDRPVPDVAAFLRTTSAGASPSDVEIDRLFAVLYVELRAMAGGILSDQVTHRTLTPTVLVNEAYLRLARGVQTSWQSRAHFLGVAAKAMRHVLVDYARRQRAQRRGGDWKRVSIPFDSEMPATAPEADVIGLHEALERLGSEDPRMAQVVELRVFAGLSAEETGHVLGLSRRTITKHWKVACLWLAHEMSEE